MNLLIVNPTNDVKLNDIIYQSANQAAKISARNSEEYTNISMISVTQAPAAVISEIDALESSYALLKKVEELGRSYDGIVVASYNDPAFLAIRELTGKPVLCSGYAAAYSAILYGREICVLAKSPLSAARQERRLNAYGFANAHFSVLPVCAREEDTFSQAVVQAAGKTARERYGANCCILGDVAMAPYGEALSDQLQLPVIDGVASAVVLVENMIRAFESLKK